MESPVYADPHFEVLLSTFNGQRFLKDQLASIESQTVEGLRLRVRDDGSADETPAILEEYASGRNWVTFERGTNIGVVSSFMGLLDSVPEDTKWVAFCDQDDVWDNDKLQRAKKALEDISVEGPAIYFSSVRLVDESGTVIGQTQPCNKHAGFVNALVENVARGCTVVLNRAAIDLLVNRNVDHSRLVMHDWWAYLVVTVFGEVVCDPEPTMDYRQHAGNVLGASAGLERWKERLSRFRHRGGTELVDFARELVRVYGEQMPPDNKRICEEFIEQAGSSSAFTRFWYALRTPVFRQSKLDNVLMRLLIVLGWR